MKHPNNNKSRTIKKIDININGLLGLSCLIFMILIVQTTYALENNETTTSSTSPLPQCVGGNIDLLQEMGSISNCLQYKEIFEEYRIQNGLAEVGIDLLNLFVTADHESNCKSYANNDERAPRGGIMQVDSPCLYHPAQCPTVNAEIDEGTKNMAAFIQRRLLNQGIRGREALWLVWFGYNRGPGTANRAIQLMKSGTPIAQATQQACEEWRQRKGRSESTCRLRSELSDIGIHYADVSWAAYQRYCEAIGGHIVEEGSDLQTNTNEQMSSTNAAIRRATTAGQTLSTTQYIPTHPYFEVPYSIEPAFQTEIDYDLNIFETIPKQIKNFERCRDDIECIVGKIREAEQENTGYNWMASYAGNIITMNSLPEFEETEWIEYCETPQKHAINSITEAIDNCAKSQQRSCACTYTIPNSNNIDLETQDSNDENNEGVFAALLGIVRKGYNEIASWFEEPEVIIQIQRTGGQTRISLLTPENTEAPKTVRTDFKGVMDGLRGDNSNQLRYTQAQAGQTIDIVKDRNGNITLETHDDSRDVCEVFNKPIKFCIKQNKTLLAYNQEEDELSMQDLVLKFAYIFKNQITDVTGFKVQDAKLLNNYTLIMWDKVQGVEVEHYTIYYTTNTAKEDVLRRTPTQEIEEDQLEDIEIFEAIDAYKKEVTNTDPLQEPKCLVPDTLCEPQYRIESEIMPEGDYFVPYTEQLYYSQRTEKYFILLPVNDAQRYIFAITATDKNMEESPSFNLPEEYHQAVADTPPALGQITSMLNTGDTTMIRINQITQNIDGSTTDTSAITNFIVYCFGERFEEDETEVSIESKEKIFGQNIQQGDEYTEFSINNAQLNSRTCGTDGPYRIIIAGARSLTDNFKGTITEDALSNEMITT